MNLTNAEVGKEYIVEDVLLEDEELAAFLFSLGCYRGEPVTAISKRRAGMVIAIKDARYSIDTALAEAIRIR